MGNEEKLEKQTMEITKKKDLKAIDILSHTVRIFTRNPNFILFTALTSFPLFLFSLYLQTQTRSFLLQASNGVKQAAESQKFQQNSHIYLYVNDYSFNVPFENQYTSEWLRSLLSNLSSDHPWELLHLSCLYLAPLNLLVLLAAIPTIDLAAKLHRDENQRALTLTEMFKTWTKLSGARLKGILVTFMYLVSFSTLTLVGFAALVFTYASVLSYNPLHSNHYYFHSFYGYVYPLRSDIGFHLLHGSNLVLLLGMYLAWGAIWNLGLVISVMEEEGRYGTRALGSAGFLCLRNVRCGMLLMFVFSAVEVVSRAPWGFEGWAVVAAQSGVLVVGNVVKWVSFVVYFDGCIDRLFVKKQQVVDDVEQG